MIGLKRGTVALCPHEKEWEDEAKRTTENLKSILGEDAVDIQHVGSTAVKSICAKPIIDIAVGAKSFEKILEKKQELKKYGLYFRKSSIENQLLFACGSFYDGTGDEQTHFVHVVIYGSKEWQDYLLVRDYLNGNFKAAKEYEALKLKLAAECPVDSGREHYLAGKHAFIEKLKRTAIVEKYLGKSVRIQIDRPIGYVHKKENYTLVYPLNYGYIPGAFGGDGEELDVYLLGVNEPVNEFSCRIIGAVYRKNDVEDKLVAAPDGVNFTAEEIREKVNFQEKWYDSEIAALPHKVVGVKENSDYYERPGVYILPLNDGKIGFATKGKGLFFIGGGKEKGESDEQTLTREVLEEVGFGVEIGRCFATAEQFKPDQTDIGYFHPYQYYYTGALTGKITEPIEKDHFLVWLTPEEAAGKFDLEMHEWGFGVFSEMLKKHNTINE